MYDRALRHIGLLSCNEIRCLAKGTDVQVATLDELVRSPCIYAIVVVIVIERPISNSSRRMVVILWLQAASSSTLLHMHDHDISIMS